MARRAPLGVLGAVDRGGAALADVLDEAVAGDGAADEIIWRHEWAEATRHGRHRQAGVRAVLDPASPQADNLRPTSPPRSLRQSPKASLVFRPRLRLGRPPAGRVQFVAAGGPQHRRPRPRRRSPALQHAGGVSAHGPARRRAARCRSSAPSRSPPGRAIPSWRSSGSRSRTAPSPSSGRARASLARYRVEMYLRVARTPPPIRFARDEMVRVADLPGDPAERRERALPAGLPARAGHLHASP